MSNEPRACESCGASFTVDDWEQAFRARMRVPPPARCPDCRQQLRTLHTNQINLFKRRCDAIGEEIVSNFLPESPYKVYSQKHWYSDKFDAAEFGREFDFSRRFFEQFKELSLAVPRPALFTDYLRDENCAYTNNAGKNKDCYLIFDSDENRDCLYSFGINGSVSAVDCYRGTKVELCYEAVDSRNCYGSGWLYNCEGCSDSFLLQNCIGCKKCIFCANLKQKEHHFRNKAVSPEKYEELRRRLQSFENLSRMLKEFSEFAAGFPQKYLHGFQNEDSSGDYLVSCKGAHGCFDCRELWDGRHCCGVFMPAKDLLDCDEWGSAELGYECAVGGYNAYNLRFCLMCLEQVSNLTYCMYCFTGSSDLFGCIGLRRKRHCILNKAYNRQEYEELVPRIIAHMEESGEWGRFFSADLSPFPYNLTKAMEWFPLTKQEARRQGYVWYEAPARDFRPQSVVIPDALSDVRDDILREVLACEECGKNLKIIAPELKFYRRLGVPLPRRCFHCRHLSRLMRRNPRVLWDRSCGRCGTKIRSSYAPARPEQVFCEKCYLESLE